jgi:hypothetical protein
MKSKKILFTCSLFALLTSAVSPALAQPAADDYELEAAAGFFHAQDADTGSLNADVALGKFLDKEPELGLRFGYQGTYNDDAPDVWTATIAPFFDYHFTGLTQDNNVIPFIGCFLGAAFNDDDFDGTTGPEAGIKFFFNKQTYVGLRYRYEWFFDDLDVGQEHSDGNHVVNVAIGYHWQD